MVAQQERRMANGDWRDRILRAAPTRLVLELVAVVAAITAVRFAWSRVLSAVYVPSSVSSAILTTILIVAVLVVYEALVRTLERRAPSELATKGALRELGAGLVYGACLFSTTIGIITLFGGYRVTAIETPTVLLASIAAAAQAGFVEEIIARGIVFRVLEEWLGTWAALAISSAFFGLAHLANPHATVWSAVAIALEAGTLLAAAYLLTRRLWLAIGLHAAWNYTQGAVFGVAVSGTHMTGLLRGTVHGPIWLSGGEFGAESSVVAVITCASLAAWFLLKVVRMNEVKVPPWMGARAANHPHTSRVP